jgi:transposase
VHTCNNPRHAGLEAQVLRLTAQMGQMSALLERLSNEVAVLRLENAELREENTQLRDENAGLRAENAQLRAQLASTKCDLANLVSAVSRSDERLRALVRREFGASSERLIADETYIPEILAALQDDQGVALTDCPGTIDDASQVPAGSGLTGAAASRSESTAPANKAKRRRPARAGGRKPLPEDIERRNRTYVPPADHPAFQNSISHEQIGTTTIERWSIGKIDIHIDCVTCPVVRLHFPQGNVSQQTVSPPAVIDRGQVSDALLAQSAVDKVVDYLPSYRQEQRALRLGVHIPRAKLCRWHMELAEFLESVADAIFAEVCDSPVIGIDDTVHRQQVPDRHRCQQTRLWAVSASDGIFYLHTPTREGAWITDLLSQYCGGVMGDAYSGHNALLKRTDIIAFFCWAHVRRKFFDAADAKRRKIMIDLIAALFGIEKDLKECDASTRSAGRQVRSKPVLDNIKAILYEWGKEVLPQSGIGRAVNYTLKLWPGLERYVDEGHAPIDNNRTERGMRPVAMNRKNSLFSGSDRGAKGYASLLTVTQTALIHKLDPVSYLNDIIEDIHFGRRPVAELTPKRYAARVASDKESQTA